MLKSVEFQNFKGVTEGKVDLSRITVLIGRNNAGKSTVLEAISFLPNPFRWTPLGYDFAIREVLRRRGAENAIPLMNYYVGSEADIYYDFDDGDRIRLAMINDKRNQTISFKFIRDDEFFDVGNLAHNGGGGGNSNVNVKPEAKSLLIAPFMYTVALERIKAQWIELANLGIPRNVATILSEQANQDYVDLVNEPFMSPRNENEIYFYLRNGKRVRIRDAGDGIQVLLVAMVLIKNENPNIILWDDFESHMHPSLLILTLNWLKDLAKEGKQIIIATHSLDVITTATELLESFDSFSVKILSLKDGKLSYKDLSPKDVKSLADANVDVRLADAIL